MDSSKQQNESKIRNKKANMGEQSTAKDNKTLFPVFSIGLANYLCKMGYEMKGVADSKYNSYYKVIYFEDSKSLRRDVDKYKNK